MDTISITITAIPAALRNRPQWVLWRNDPKLDKPGETAKVPYSDVSRRAQTNNPKTWLTFDTALQRYQANPAGWAGLGYVFTAHDPYTGIDLDTCLDAGELPLPWAQAILDDLMPTYAEISPSGTGIKLWVETEQSYTLGSSAKDAGQAEIYSFGRWFAVTGQAIDGAPASIGKASHEKMTAIIAGELARRASRKPATPATNGTHPAHTNGSHEPLTLVQLTNVLDRLAPTRWEAYNDWLKIGMALHSWTNGDAQRLQAAFGLFDLYSKERAPDAYGGTAEKWASFGKRNGMASHVTVGTLIQWANEDSGQHGATVDEPPHPAAVAGDQVDEPETRITLAPMSSCPELPAKAMLAPELGADACPWLDEYIAFSRRWSPQSYDGFHEACGLWVLSTVAARRVMLPFGGERFPSLYIALCARTSLWAKSTAARIAKETMTAAGLGALLAPDISTPQAFLRRLAEKVPSDYGKETPDAQAAHRAALAFAGQRGWWHEEFGSHLAGMMREGGMMADFRGHLRALDDGPATYSYDTVGHGLNIIKRPYLALLANLTPADLAPFARKGSALWGDGYFARFAFVTPPADAPRSRERFPDGWREVPPALSWPLQEWHDRLGVPSVELEEQFDDKQKASCAYRLTVTPVNPERCTLGPGVVDALYTYREALTDLVDAGDNTDLDGSYSRFAEKALRIAMLLASVSNEGRIELTHWARGQAIAERWRQSLHHLIDQLGQSEDTPERTQEMKVLRVLERRGSMPARDVARFANISTGEAQRILDQLITAGDLQVEAGKRTKRYRLVQSPAPVVSVVVSQPSYPAQSYDTSGRGGTPVQELSCKSNNDDTNDYTTVTTPPSEDVPPPLERQPAITLAPGVEPPRITPDTMEIDRGRIQELMEGGLSQADAPAQAKREARASLDALNRRADLARRYEIATGEPLNVAIWPLDELDDLETFVIDRERQAAA